MERTATFAVHILSALTGRMSASLAEEAKFRLSVLYSGRGGVPGDEFRGLLAAQVSGWRFQCTGGRRIEPPEGSLVESFT